MDEAAADALCEAWRARAGAAGPEADRELRAALYAYRVLGSPKAAGALRLLGRLCADRGEHGQAANWLQQALELAYDADTFRAFEAAAVAARRHHQLAGLVHRRALAAADPAERLALLERADELYRRENAEFPGGRDRNCGVDIAVTCARLGARERGLRAVDEVLRGCPEEFAGAFLELRRYLEGGAASEAVRAALAQ